MTNPEQPRTPGGRPDGGQYASRGRHEADPSQVNLTGSFHYPPVFTSAAQLYRENYNELNRHHHVAMRPVFAAEFDQTQPRPAGDDTSPAVQEWERAREEYVRNAQIECIEVMKQRPRDPHPSDIRVMVQAALIEHYADQMVTDDLDYERYRAREHTLMLTTGPKQIGAINYELGMYPNLPELLHGPAPAPEPAPVQVVMETEEFDTEQIEEIVAHHTDRSAFDAANQQMALIDERFDENAGELQAIRKDLHAIKRLLKDLTRR